jgi:hypothetical protein
MVRDADDPNAERIPPMPDADFQHIRASMVNDVAVIEIGTREVQGMKLAQELGAELALVRAQEWARRLVVNFVRVGSLSSTGFAALFKPVSRAKAEGRQVKFCGMEPGERPLKSRLRPEGATTRQPRATPWGIKTKSIRGALKGRDKGRLHVPIASLKLDPSQEIERRVRPFQGTAVPGYSVPRAWPWAGM